MNAAFYKNIKLVQVPWNNKTVWNFSIFHLTKLTEFSTVDAFTVVSFTVGGEVIESVSGEFLD